MAHVYALTVNSGGFTHGRRAEIFVYENDATEVGPDFSDLPADMQQALREWVGAAEIWREGWYAMGQEHIKQRNDPMHPIGEGVDNPYKDGTF